MAPKHLLTFSVFSNRTTLVVGSRGISADKFGVSFVTKSLSWVWLWPWSRQVPGHKYVSEVGMHYRTLSELKAADKKPNITIILDKLNRIH
jgi:hypothetical protein